MWMEERPHRQLGLQARGNHYTLEGGENHYPPAQWAMQEGKRARGSFRGTLTRLRLPDGDPGCEDE